jgi:ribosome-binding ATPase YchF (GTP1/OBG family)
MSLSVGIVGLPNVGKSTLFNALLKKQAAYVANFPFATIEPNVGVVPVPDERLGKLAEVVKVAEKMDHLPPEVPATVKFVDIAGLIKGASKGEGLGNKFLSHIRETDAILYLLRDFKDENVIRAGSVNPKEDLETLQMELELADLDSKEKVNLLAKKPGIVVYNTDEDKLVDDGPPDGEAGLRICAKMEEELANLSPEDQKEYLKQLGITKTGLEKVIQTAFDVLGLQTFLTAGEKEVRAWTIRLGSTSLMASGTIHTDFMAKFIKAEVVKFEDFISVGGWKKARELGKMRLEGRDYVMQDGDVVEFKIGC